jgi:hypothetical protein
MAGIGDLCIQLRNILDRIDTINAQLKDVKADKDRISGEIKSLMEGSGVDSVKNAYAGITVTLREDLEPTYDPEKYEGIFQWCARVGREDFVQRRLSGAKIREFVDSGGGLPPGLTLTPVTKVTFRRS